MMCIERRKICLQKGLKIRKHFEEIVNELVLLGVSNLWGHFKDRVLRACDEMCWKRMVLKNK